MTRPEPVRAVVVGAGLMGRWHAHALRRAGGTLVGVVDPDAARAHALAHRHPGARVVPELDQALASLPTDVVHICSPVDTHTAVAAAALDAGCHVLVEKPVAATAVETDELLAHAARARRLLCPVHQFLFQRGTLRAAALLDALGPVLHIDMLACSAGATGATPDRADRVALEILPHPLSVLEHLLPGCLGRLEWDVLRPAAGELRALGRADAWSATILVSMAGRPTVNAMRITGARGTVHVDFFHGYHVLESGGVSRARKIARPFDLAGRTLAAATGNLLRRVLTREPAYPGLLELVRRFYSAASAGGPPPIPVAATGMVARVVAMIAAGAASASAPGSE